MKTINTNTTRKLLEGNMYIFSMKTSSNGLMAYLPQDVVKNGKVVGLPIWGKELTKKLNAAKAGPLSAAANVAVKVDDLQFVFAHGYKYIEEAIAKAEATVSTLLEKEIYPHINTFRDNYQAAVEAELDAQKLTGEVREKTLKTMMDKFPYGGPKVAFKPTVLCFPTTPEGTGEMAGALKASKEQLDVAVFKELLGTRLKKLFEVGVAAEVWLMKNGNCHASTLKAAQSAYAQIAADIEQMEVPALTTAMEGFKAVLIDNAENIGAAYCHFLNSNIYQIAVSMGVGSQLSTKKIGSPEDLLLAAADMPMDELIETVKGE